MPILLPHPPVALLNHTPHFPYFVTHYVDSMPIGSIGGALSDVLFNPKCARHIWKVAVTIDSLGNIVWICPLAPGTSADVLIGIMKVHNGPRGISKIMNLVPMMVLIKAVYIVWCLSLGTLPSQSGTRNTMMSTIVIGLGWNICSAVCGIGGWRNIWRGNGTTLHKSIRIFVTLHPGLSSAQGLIPP